MDQLEHDCRSIHSFKNDPTTKERRKGKSGSELPCRTMKGTEEASVTKVEIRATIAAALRKPIFFL